MYGPTWEFPFKRGERYKLPTGYGFSGDIFNGGYHYGEYEYVGPIKQEAHLDKYLVFREGDKYVFCAPSTYLLGDILQINMNPRHFGPLKEIVTKIGCCEWDLSCTEQKPEDMPSFI